MFGANPAQKGATIYGVHFQNLGSERAFSLFEAIYSPSNGEQFLPKPLDGDIRAQGSEPLTPTHHAYYMRIIRRIEQAHKSSPLDTDKLLYARLHEGRPLKEAIVELGLSTDDGLDDFLSSIFGVPYIDLAPQPTRSKLLRHDSSQRRHDRLYRPGPSDR